jgi:hypothetical protein
MRCLALLLLCLCNLAAHAAPVGTQFTYQGKLEDNNQPANGLFDFEFRLFDALAGGAQTGGVVLSNDIPVENGVFSVELDFGAGAFGSQARWLAVAVRDGNSSGSYDALTPRQALTAAPVAQFALAGNPGPQGPSGVVQVVTQSGQINNIPVTAGTPWVFAGPFAVVTVTAGQRVSGTSVGGFGHASVNPQAIDVTLCFSDNVNGAVPAPFGTLIYIQTTLLVPPERTMVTAATSRVMDSAGSFRVGLCIRNRGVVAFNSNEFVSGWFMVSNN